MLSSYLFYIGLLAMIIGFLLLFGYLIYLAIKGSNREREVRGGGIIIIGPIPIVFGSSKGITRTLLILAIALTLLSIILFLLQIILYK
jgi:uncharacterized protein (TIGR00304 family)